MTFAVTRAGLMNYIRIIAWSQRAVVTTPVNGRVDLKPLFAYSIAVKPIRLGYGHT